MSHPDYMKQIVERIADAPDNSIFVPSDFLDLAEMPNVSKALSRLAQQGINRR